MSIGPGTSRSSQQLGTIPVLQRGALCISYMPPRDASHAERVDHNASMLLPTVTLGANPP